MDIGDTWVGKVECASLTAKVQLLESLQFLELVR